MKIRFKRPFVVGGGTHTGRRGSTGSELKRYRKHIWHDFPDDFDLSLLPKDIEVKKDDGKKKEEKPYVDERKLMDGERAAAEKMAELTQELEAEAPAYVKKETEQATNRILGRPGRRGSKA